MTKRPRIRLVQHFQMWLQVWGKRTAFTMGIGVFLVHLTNTFSDDSHESYGSLFTGAVLPGDSINENRAAPAAGVMPMLDGITNGHTLSPTAANDMLDQVCLERRDTDNRKTPLIISRWARCKVSSS